MRYVTPTNLCVIFLLFAGQVAAQDPCSTAQLEVRDKGWANAAFEKDLQALLNFYHSDAVQLAPEGAVIDGPVELRALFSELFDDPDYSLNWTLEEARVSESCDLGYTRGDYVILWRNSEGVLIESTGKYLGVWIKDDKDSWVVLEDIFTTGSERSVE